MFFGGGISGFFNDLYYGAVEKGYKLVHPEIWDCVLKSQSEATADNRSEDIIDAFRSVGVEDEELFDLIEQSGDMDSMTYEESEELMKQLREKKVTVDLSKFAENLENDWELCGREKTDSSGENTKIPETDTAGQGHQKSEDLKAILRIMGRKANPYDTFPEEKKYYSPEEVMEIIQRLSNLMKD